MDLTLQKGEGQLESDLQNSGNRNLCSTFKMECFDVSEHLLKYP